MINKCNCKHDFQDKRYGLGNRIFNPMMKEGHFRCSVCGKDTVMFGEKKEKKTKEKKDKKNEN